VKGVPSIGSPPGLVRRGLAGFRVAYRSYSFLEGGESQGLPDGSPILAPVHLPQGEEPPAVAVKLAFLNPNTVYRISRDHVPQVHRRCSSRVLSDKGSD